MRKLVCSVLVAISASTFVAGCDDDEMSPDEEWGMEGPMTPTPPPGKEDSEYRRGILVNTDTSRTQVWTARHRWEDTDTAAAKLAGMAWPANSGLTWDQKYARWIDSLGFIPSVDHYSTTVQLTTPWGKTLASPMLECAELALFLRISFAAWYELPLFFEAQDSQGRRVYFGHNGVRTATGRYAQTPEFAIKYKDHTKTYAAGGAWPTDAALRAKRIAGGTDDQPMIAADAHFGAYLDELHLNKRVGYFTVLALDYLGSVNLADPANAYNIAPDSLRAGDILIERWQRSGIGHTLVVKEVDELPGGSRDAITISGSMPRRQGVRQSGTASKGYFTSAYTGGQGTNSDGDEYARLGGGAKRFRVTKNIGGYWTNTWMAADEASWINSTDSARIAARPARFEQMLGQVSPGQQRAELLQQIADARHHLAQYPASCSARERREQAFSALYELSERAFGQSTGQVDAAYRKLEDYVFGALEYGQSKTCCWNSSTAAMHDIVMDRARAEQPAGRCIEPTVFKSHSDGYQRWASHAASIGRGAEWRAWSEDEPCTQRNVPADVEATAQAVPYCSLAGGSDPGPACTDAFEPNNSRATARPASGTIDGLRICASDDDWFTFPAGGTVRIEFAHTAGDLDITAHDASGAQVAVSQSTNDREQVVVPPGGSIRVYGYAGAQNTYRLIAP
ncbi:MAG: PPC domain-containing protein [Kofleriaceae bacterium]